jgi:hypothetical protein
MHQIGDEIDGYCPRCRLNTYQNVSAMDGSTVLSATCRTCRNTFAWKPEVSPDDMRAQQMKKLNRLQRTRMTSAPEVTSRTRRKVGDLDQLRAMAKAIGHDIQGEVPAAPGAPAATATSGIVSGTPTATDRWRVLTANLGWRDGKPYKASSLYKAGDVVLHKAHGLGVVQQVVHDNACLVLFRDSEAVMEMGAPPND